LAPAHEGYASFEIAPPAGMPDIAPLPPQVAGAFRMAFSGPCGLRAVAGGMPVVVVVERGVGVQARRVGSHPLLQ